MRLFLACVLAMLFVEANADGQLEINQLCVATGCFAGDDPGWPVEITASGSYRLTSNLDVPFEEEGIRMSGDDVTLDLGGFFIQSSVRCTGNTPTCAPTSVSQFAGILSQSDRATIRNGGIRGFPGDCILSRGSDDFIDVSNLQISDCGDQGIDAFFSDSGVIRNVRIANVDGNGVISGSGSKLIVRDSFIKNAGERGVSGVACSGNVFISNADAIGGGAQENCAFDDGTNF